MAKDLYDKAFDEGTKFKLSIFQSYLEEWIPVFTRTKSPFKKEVKIFDFFAGEGKDMNGHLGSPLIILNAIKKFKPADSGINLNIYLNEFDKRKFNLLQKSVGEAQHSDVNITLSNLSFEKAFNKYYPEMTDSANFLFLDQCGVKFITEDIYLKIVSLPVTDFLFFISSSYFKRFGNDETFKKYIRIDINESKYFDIHRSIFNHYKNLISKTRSYFVAPFSIKKKASIYGLIFGTSHALGIFKFLDVCWKKNEITGEANFDIDVDRIDLSKRSLFEELNKSKKIMTFEREIESKIVNKEISDEKSLILYGLESGFLPKHIKPVISKLISEGSIEKFSLRISRDVIKNMSYSNKINLK